MKYYKISEEDLLELLNEVEFGECLTGAGVDSWEGYDYAQEYYTPLCEVPDGYEEIK